MRLAISKSSFHYKYYEVLRALWGFNKCEYKTTSLCTYSQFVFWMTLATVALSPLLILGWTLLKIGRLSYKILSLTKMGRAIIDFMDSVFGIGGMLEKISDEMVDNPMFSLCFFAFGIIITIAVIVGIPLIIIMGWSLIISALWNFIVAVLGFIYALGVALFYISVFLTFCAIKVGLFFAWLGSNIWTFLTGAGLWISYIGIALVVGSVISVLLVKIALSIDKVNQFIMFKINGFHGAREENKERRDLLIEERNKIRKEMMKNRKELEEKKRKGEIPYTRGEIIAMTLENALRKFSLSIVRVMGIIYSSLFSKTKQVGSGTVKVLGVFGILWNIIKSIKEGVCPFLEFIEEEDIK